MKAYKGVYRCRCCSDTLISDLRTVRASDRLQAMEMMAANPKLSMAVCHHCKEREYGDIHGYAELIGIQDKGPVSEGKEVSIP